MKIIEELSSEITEKQYKIESGKITLYLQYRTKSIGFLICVSNAFSSPCNWENDSLLNIVDASIQRHGDTCEFDLDEKNHYQFFYVKEKRLINGRIPLPASVKLPARIEILWQDELGNFHLGKSKVDTVYVPLSIIIKKHRYKKSQFLRKLDFCDITLECANPKLLKDGAIYYQVNNSDSKYPIPLAFIENRATISIKVPNEETNIRFKLESEYQNQYRVKEIMV